MIQPLDAQIEKAFFTFLRSCSSLIPPLILLYHHHFLNLKTILIITRDRAEGGAGGALAPPLFCKNKN